MYDVNLRVHLPCERSPHVLALVILDHGSKFLATFTHTSGLPCVVGCQIFTLVQEVCGREAVQQNGMRQPSGRRTTEARNDSVLYLFRAVRACISLQINKSENQILILDTDQIFSEVYSVINYS